MPLNEKELRRHCTCHPDERPPICQHRFAFSECEREYLKTRLSTLEAEKKAAVALVRDAYNEGFAEGMREHTSSRGGKVWAESRAARTLTDDVTVSGTGTALRAADAVMDELRNRKRLRHVLDNYEPFVLTDIRECIAERIWDAFKASSQAFAQGAEGWTKGFEAGLEAAAQWHDERAKPLVTSQHIECQRYGWAHENNSKAIRALPVPPPSSPEPQKGAGKE